MAVSLEVGGVTFQFPTNNGIQWGNSVTNWAIAVTDALQSVVVPGDIGPTTLASIGNNITTPTNVTNLNVSIATVRAFIVTYYIYRGRGTPDNSEYTEVGTMRGVYKPTAGTWDLDNTYTGDADVEFSITQSGQIRYTSSNISGTGTYFGSMRFRLDAFPV